jgi:hypothetical protein
MSSEQLADGVNPLDAELAATWDLLKGYSGRDTDLGIARRFGGASAAYSLRDIGAMNGKVVRVRRDSDAAEEDFSANQVASGALETFVIDGASQKGLDQSTWQATGVEGDFVSTSTDGFSYQHSSGTAFIGVTLSETLALNDSVFVSFNASGVDIPDESPQIRLRDSVSGGSASSSLIGVVNNGFNSFQLTYDQSSYANGDNIVFSEGNTGGGTVTISDFKVFGVSRNGFVQTWYDQSGNGNNASQASAGSQPYIISNGNQVTLDNGTPSIAFERITGSDSLSISTPIANEPYTFFATTVNNASNAWFRLFGESNAAPTVFLKNNNNIDYTPSDSDSSGNISAATTSDNIVSGFSGVNGGADGILRFNGTNLKTDISRTQDGDSISLIGRFPNNGTGFAHIESLVFYESDLTADFDTIEKELAQPINIL